VYHLELESIIRRGVYHLEGEGIIRSSRVSSGGGVYHLIIWWDRVSSGVGEYHLEGACIKKGVIWSRKVLSEKRGRVSSGGEGIIWSRIVI
jgi:hypothetical protein